MGAALASAPVVVPRLHADEVAIDDDLVRGLLRTQLPRWADLPLRRLPTTGTDNAIYRLGDDLGIRLPRIGWAVDQVATEHEWLPRLGAHLPVAVPEPLAVGEPGGGYPYPWLVYRWLDGDDAMVAGTVAGVGDWTDLVAEVAGFVLALQQIDATGGPSARGRSGPLAPAAESGRRAIRMLDGTIDRDRALAVWEAGLAADPWVGPPVWVHGDLLPGNLLVAGGRLVGVIDWSAAAVGDPACDAMLAWSLPSAARATYRAALDLDDATWARARAWSLQQAAQFIPYYAETIPTAVAAARRRLTAILADD